MSRTEVRSRIVIGCWHRLCPACGRRMRIRYENRCTLVTLTSTVRLRLKIHRCKDAPASTRPIARKYRPEAEGALALSKHEFSLDGVA